MFRPAQTQDHDGIIALWCEAFADTCEAVDGFFAVFPDCRSYVAEEDGRILSMVHALPQVLRAEDDLQAAYVYAVATARDARGHGLCAGLMSFAEDDLRSRGFACAVLTPGEPSLFRFYEKQGYKTVFFRSRNAFGGGQEVSAADYARLRERYLPGAHMVYDVRTLEYARNIYGLRFYDTAVGCAAAGASYTAEVLPDDCGGAPHAMIKWLRGEKPLKEAYLGFSLE